MTTPDWMTDIIRRALELREQGTDFNQALSQAARENGAQIHVCRPEHLWEMEAQR